MIDNRMKSVRAKAKDIWYAWFPGDYASKTAHLSLLEHGAYRVLLDHYYQVGGNVVANATGLLRVCRAFDPEEQAAVRAVLREFFYERDGYYRHERADAEIAKRAELREKRAAAGSKGGTQKAAASAKQKPPQLHLPLSKKDSEAKASGSKLPPDPTPRVFTDQSGDYPKGVNIPGPLRAAVLERDRYKCVRCNASEDLAIDHIFPQSMGGTHAFANLRTLCRKCNSGRPVQGEALVEDLARDGLSIEDLPHVCGTKPATKTPTLKTIADVVMPLDFKRNIFAGGVPLLMQTDGVTEKSARAMLGMWRRDYGDVEVLNALASAQGNAVTEVIPYVQKILKGKPNGRPNGRDQGQPRAAFDVFAEAYLDARAERERLEREAARH